MPLSFSLRYATPPPRYATVQRRCHASHFRAAADAIIDAMLDMLMMMLIRLLFSRRHAFASHCHYDYAATPLSLFRFFASAAPRRVILRH